MKEVTIRIQGKNLPKQLSKKQLKQLKGGDGGSAIGKDDHPAG